MEIKHYEKNTKKHSDKQLEQLGKIIKEIGWRQPILVNQKGVIVTGHGRFMTYQKYGEKLKLKEPWVMDDKGKTIMGAPDPHPLTKDQEKAYRIADNKVNESDWNMDLVISELKGLDMDLVSIAGFDLSKISDEFADLGKLNKEVNFETVEGGLEHTCPKCRFKFSD
jgi:hypothetical protein